ncbi:hypothetical protein VA7868_01995 [Vibrio aerogenes CECT 7868]|uniref:UPF0761 membrane protein VA7868_01995 n=1 Tax=Vibrio aerogenes CECT 7868 TaxID=1216006 RepID=A0A1M5YU31_9VIBR|nr:hypothetical protein VA7868_01995 [Vibrio aerogenes CECT 7868]
MNAGYLAYISLLSLVPMLTVLLSVLSAFSLFDGVGDTLQTFIISHFVPTAGEAINQALREFVSNTSKMTTFGGIFLFVVSLSLISNIDKTLNYIWRVKKKRRWALSFSVYWTILTLGPLFMGTSIAVTSYVTSLNLIDNETFNSVTQILLRWLPFLLTLSVFTGLYIFVPNTPVQVRHAVYGAFVAAMLFELSKKCFALYITHFPSYQLIYGAIAIIPILFVWVFLSWLIVLLGAEVTASLGEYNLWRQDADVIESEPLSGQMIETEERKNCDSIDSEGV